MEKLTIEATFETPGVVLDPSSGLLELSGRSHPEDAVSFYKPVFYWIQAYIQETQPSTRIVIKLEYFNTATSKVLMHLFSKFEESGNTEVHWYHFEEDEDMLESGKEFAELVDLRFSYFTME